MSSDSWKHTAFDSQPSSTGEGVHWVGGGGVLQKPLLHTWPSAHGTSGQVVTSLLWHSMSVSVAQN
ncbi:hypothetical protein [Nannocystis pusilla]|uniref:hypothetical protein n=1 Tax=Nannocystis pusilla TaxID=889268 RepID=UPI003B8066F6